MGYLVSLLVLALMVFALVDIIRRDDSQVRYMPKFAWLLLVILLLPGLLIPLVVFLTGHH